MKSVSRNLLAEIKSPDDIKKLDLSALNALAEEIRQEIVLTVSNNGGHLASNLGTVELCIALHRVFNSPSDKIVWDVGHQCYAHKLITGRLASFSSLRKLNGLSGFPKRGESPHDAFNTGHASTSISAALGLLAAERIQGGQGHAIAVIGDGALTGGLAYEALSHAGHLSFPLIVILNDNKMSINANVGGLSKYLSRLSMKERYQNFRRSFDAMAKKIPFIGEAFFNLVVKLKRAVKAVFYTDNFFVDLGFEYVGPIGGHNIKVLIEVLEDIRKLNRPVVLHVITLKGKGYGYAEDDPGSYHGVGSFSVDDRLPSTESPVDAGHERKLTFTDAFANAASLAAEKDKRVAAVTAAMKTGTGLSDFAKAFPERFFDVGIAEEHAVTFAAGLAARGLKPIVAIYSTFIQRSVDQVIHDAALQRLPVILALDRAGFSGADGETHQGLFDIALFRGAPNMTILSPASAAETRLMLEWALGNNPEEIKAAGPVIIRYPKAYCPREIPAFALPIENGRGVWIRGIENAEICLAFTGGLYSEAAEAAEILKKKGHGVDLYNLRFLKPVDELALRAIMDKYKIVCFIEEGVRSGGFGEYAAAMAARENSAAKIITLAVESEFLAEDKALGTREELLALNGLNGGSVADTIARARAG